MKQITFSDVEYSKRRRITKREEFLDTMDTIIPWTTWIAMIAPYYPEGKRGRRPIEIEVKLRMYLLQVWFSISDEGLEDAVYDSYAMRKFMGINFIDGNVPDATTLLKFRHLLEEHDLCEAFFKDIKERLEKSGLMMHGGTIVDATIIHSTSSTKNRKGKRDPEMHQTKKGNQWYHGMKVHIGVDAGSGYVHTIVGTAANVHDLDAAAQLFREDDKVGYGDSGYTGIEKRDEIRSDEHLSKMEFRIGTRPSSLKMAKDYDGFHWDHYIEGRKASVRCKVEHVFLIVKRQLGYSKTAYRGIRKNINRFYMLFGCANLIMCLRAHREEEFCAVIAG